MREKGYDFFNPIALDEISADDVNKASAAQVRKQAEYDAIRQLVKDKRDVSLRDVCKELSIDVGRATRLIADLVTLGDLDSSGTGRDMRIEPGPDMIAEEEEALEV